MNSGTNPDPAETKKVIDEIRELGYGNLFEDREARRKLVFGFLAENSKGETAKLAEQLLNGTVTSVQALSDPRFAEFVGRGLSSLEELGPTTIREGLDELAEMDVAEDAPDDPLTVKVEDWAARFSDFDDDDEDGGSRL